MIATKGDALEVIEFVIGELLTAPGHEMTQHEALIEVFIGALSMGAQQPRWAERLMAVIDADAYRLDGMTRQEVARAVADLEPVVRRRRGPLNAMVRPEGGRSFIQLDGIVQAVEWKIGSAARTAVR